MARQKRVLKLRIAHILGERWHFRRQGLFDGPIYWYALVFFAALVSIELFAMAAMKRAGYSLGASLASLGVGFGHKLSTVIKYGAGGGLALVLWQHRIAEV